jgi:beta-lactamase regulating signal transducer with metallopeptidase domain
VRRRQWVPLGVLAGLIGAHAAMSARLIPCPTMSMSECLTAAIALVAAASVAAIVIRAGFLAVRTTRAIARLDRVPLPEAVREASQRTGVGDVVCVAGGELTGFCAGLLRPQVYVTAVSAGPELDAVLVHEAAHARRRDPLRRVLARAASDVLFYLPLASWWSARQMERSELSADRAAIDHVGRHAVAAALMSADQGRVASTVTAFDGATPARVAQLLGDDLPVHRPSPARVMASLLGAVLAVSLTMCLGQAVVAVLPA